MAGGIEIYVNFHSILLFSQKNLEIGVYILQLFLYRIILSRYWRTCIIFVDLTNSFSARTIPKHMHNFSALKLSRNESTHVFLRDPYMLRERISFPFNLNSSRINIAFNLFSMNETRFSFSIDRLNLGNFPIHLFSLALILLKLK